MQHNSFFCQILCFHSKGFKDEKEVIERPRKFHIPQIIQQHELILLYSAQLLDLFFFELFLFMFSLDGFSPEYGVTFLTTIIDKFAVSFGREGETMSLGCTVIVYPNVKRYQPEIVWSRNGGSCMSSLFHCSSSVILLEI